MCRKNLPTRALAYRSVVEVVKDRMNSPGGPDRSSRESIPETKNTA